MWRLDAGVQTLIIYQIPDFAKVVGNLKPRKQPLMVKDKLIKFQKGLDKFLLPEHNKKVAETSNYFLRNYYLGS
jgi:hypothetical protein